MTIFIPMIIIACIVNAMAEKSQQNKGEGE